MEALSRMELQAQPSGVNRCPSKEPALMWALRDTWGKPRVDDRRVISGIILVLISGCRWKDAPGVYGPRKTLYNRFQRWAAKGAGPLRSHTLATVSDPPAPLDRGQGSRAEYPAQENRRWKSCFSLPLPQP